MESEQAAGLENLEERKLKEIEHSRVRRQILQGSERHADTNKSEEAENISALVRDKVAFKLHFSNIKFYSITKASEDYQRSWMQERCKAGTSVLDFACGSGENGILAAEFGAHVQGMDISPEGVANANLNARQTGVADHCRFEVMDGENMKYADNTFDYAVEYGALHHVELNAAMSELARVIKPDGEMICIEAMRHNPFIHAYRRRTPHLRTAWEVDHILGVESLDVMRKYFRRVDTRFFHLAVLAAVPLRKTFLFKPMRAVMNVVDRWLLSTQAIGKYGWIMAITIGEPIKGPGS
jgi:ubiquinone/menaquinone biosynthesis C-methylase UbiE